MTTRTQEQILADLLANTGRAGKLRRKLAANKSRNWLLALMLHSFGRFAEHSELSDLEAGIIKAFRQNGYSDADLINEGKLALKLPSAVRAELFPPEFATLSSGSAFTLDQVRAAAPGIIKTMPAQPDAAVVHADRTALHDVWDPPAGGPREHAATTIASEPNAQAAAAARAATFKIKAVKFRCNHRATDSVFNQENEFYVIFGSLGADAKTTTTQSQIFNHVDTGDTRNFSAVDGNIWGPGGAAQPLPPGEVGVLLSAWEHDSGDTTKVRAGIAAAFTAASVVLAATGVAAWVGAVVSGVGGVVTWLVSFMDDDHICDVPFVLYTADLNRQLTAPGSSVSTDRRLTDGNADYTITITSTRTS